MGNCLWWKREEEIGRKQAMTSLSLFSSDSCFESKQTPIWHLVVLSAVICLYYKYDLKEKGEKKGGLVKHTLHPFFMDGPETIVFRNVLSQRKKKTSSWWSCNTKHSTFHTFSSSNSQLWRCILISSYQKCFFSFSHPKEWLLRWFHSVEEREEERGRRTTKEWMIFLPVSVFDSTHCMSCTHPFEWHQNNTRSITLQIWERRSLSAAETRVCIYPWLYLPRKRENQVT